MQNIATKLNSSYLRSVFNYQIFDPGMKLLYCYFNNYDHLYEYLYVGISGYESVNLSS
jgi:hypothetical protein